MNIASIDIGSNTVLLLVASVSKGTLFPIINKYASPRLGKGLQIGGEIREDGIKHLIEILKEYKSIINTYDCSEVILTATNAMRIAANSDEIISKVKNELNFNIRIIPGEEEARLSYLGASSSFSNLKEKMVIDIGGGSTEIIYGNDRDIFYKHSFQIGVVSLTENLIGSFPYSIDCLNNTNLELISIFNELETKIPKHIPTIAVAGTPTTLSCIKQNLHIYDEVKVEGSVLNNSDLDELKITLQNLSASDIKQMFGQVVSGREDVLFAGTMILQHITNILKLNTIFVSSRGIRYGNIIDYANTLKV
jgi:exopolyphosphatase/guanosine-5'-triphosphate,3'-diphosphate pyrophosphatase